MSPAAHHPTTAARTRSSTPSAATADRDDVDLVQTRFDALPDVLDERGIEG